MQNVINQLVISNLNLAKTEIKVYLAIKTTRKLTEREPWNINDFISLIHMSVEGSTREDMGIVFNRS